MEKIAKVAFIIVPLILLILGVAFVIWGGLYWLELFSPTQVESYDIVWDKPSPIDAIVFLPKVIRLKDSPIQIEFQLSQSTKAPSLIVVMAEIRVEDCMFLRAENPKGYVTFNNTTLSPQSFSGYLYTRNLMPTDNCTIQTKVTGAELGSEFTGSFSRNVPVDTWTDKALSLATLLLGFATSFFGFKGLKGLSSK